MNWQNRLRQQITLTAPDGSAYSAGWKGNDIEAGLLVGQFNAPLRDGTTTQPLGSKGLSWPLTLSFEGDDHDTAAMAFFQAFLHQRGTWKVQHPVYGQHELQAITGTLSADPTGSGNVTVVQTQWVEPAKDDGELSTAELAQGVLAQVDTAQLSASQAFTANTNLTDAESQAAAASAGLSGLGSVMASPLGTLAKGSAEISSTFLTAYAQASAALTAGPLDLITAASQIQSVLTLPALVGADLSAKVQAFGALASSIQDSLTAGNDASARNGAVVGELFLAGALAGASTSTVVGLPANREQALSVITALRSMFDTSTAALDAVQASNSGNPASGQYFSNSASYADLALLLSRTCAYLLRVLFDLKVAKRFTLAVPRSPIEITLTEYGSEYAADGVSSNLDLFIASNGLRANDVVLLPAGREVVVYV